MRRFSELPSATRTLWAKSGTKCGHGLLVHLLDVAAVAETIVLRESPQTRAWAAAAFGLPIDSAARWLGALAGLHDFGKAIPGFQAKWPDGQRADEVAGLPFRPAVSLKATRHDLASVVLLRSELSRRFRGASWIRAVSQALGAHHGYFPRPQELQTANPAFVSVEWSQAWSQLLEVYFLTIAPIESPELEEVTPPAAAWLAGLTSVADWIASNPEWFPLGERADVITEHYLNAQGLAERALREIGWPEYRPLLSTQAESDTLVTRILGHIEEQVIARPLQQAADRLLEDTGPALMIVEAPMGEGKTELAFLAHLRLQAANGHRGLYVALPTQATGNAMFERALIFLRNFSTDIRLDVQLVHGAAMLDERVHRLRGVNASMAESVSSSAWFSQRKRPLLSPYGVGTIDQALIATLHVKHHFVRLWGLANRVVVLDEIHAYDTYTSGLIEALLRWLRAMNCSVVLMSATLPAKRRAAFLQAWGAKSVPDIAYPRVLVASGEQVRGEHVPCRPLKPIFVTGIAEGLDKLAAAALECLSNGGCGVVIVNTVQRAQDLYSSLRSQVGDGAELLLFHARYPADERAEREKVVLEKFGRGDIAQRPPRALLVATQVVEQSLDIDFDFMITDLAPVDLLLQRAGRLHRHDRQRPMAHAVPRLVVAGFQREYMPELKETAWGFVYDPYTLYRTWIIAGAEPIWRLPEDIDRLVQAVYAKDPFNGEERDEYLKTLDQALGQHLAIVQQQRQHAINVALDAEGDLSNAYLSTPRANEEGEGEGLQVMTRLGDKSLAVVPIWANNEGWRLFPTGEPFDPNVEPEHVLAHRIYRRQVRLSRRDLVNSLLEQPVPMIFESHPLLRDLRPLLLADNVAQFDRLRVHLDPELGITYETLKAEDA